MMCYYLNVLFQGQRVNVEVTNCLVLYNRLPPVLAQACHVVNFTFTHVSRPTVERLHI